MQFGRVTGAYAHDALQAGRHRSHSLPVDWLGEPVSKTVVGQDLVHTLNGSLTVFQSSRNDAERRLEAIARGKPDPGFTEGLPRPVATPADHTTTEVTDPETAPTVVAIRDRIRAHVAGEFREHELTRLVAEILTVLGFRCEVSPPGPDGGVDIIAGTGPLGLDAPTLIVEVKSEPTPIGSRVLRGLH
ncbi:restriction endonuclease, partial [Streptomyces sp. NPDC059618]